MGRGGCVGYEDGVGYIMVAVGVKVGGTALGARVSVGVDVSEGAQAVKRAKIKIQKI